MNDELNCAVLHCDETASTESIRELRFADQVMLDGSSMPPTKLVTWVCAYHAALIERD